MPRFLAGAKYPHWVWDPRSLPGALLSAGTWPGRGADYSSPSGSEIKVAVAVSPFLHMTV